MTLRYFFYILGEFTESDQYSIAIVGTRQPTNYGKVQAEKISMDLSKQGITIVSGMARGIDSIAHNAAIKSGGRTIAGNRKRTGRYLSCRKQKII